MYSICICITPGNVKGIASQTTQDPGEQAIKRLFKFEAMKNKSNK